MSTRPYVPVFRSYYEVAKGLPPAERLSFLDALLAYAFDEEGFPSDLPPVVKNYLTLIQPTIDSTADHFRASSAGGKKSAEIRGKKGRN